MSPLRSALPFWMSLALVPLAGLAMARLGDAKGYFGRVVQSLVIEKR